MRGSLNFNSYNSTHSVLFNKYVKYDMKQQTSLFLSACNRPWYKLQGKGQLSSCSGSFHEKIRNSPLNGKLAVAATADHRFCGGTELKLRC